MYFGEAGLALIQLIDVDTLTITPELTKFGIKIIGQMIESENKNKHVLTEKIKSLHWQPKDWRKYKNQVFIR